MPSVPRFTTSFSATDVNKAGSRVYDDAWVKGGVEITRRGQRFVLLRQDYLAKLIEEASDDKPRCLDDLLRDYDREKINALTADFAEAPPSGKEII